MTRQELRVFFQKWQCGCGSPESSARLVYDVLRTIQQRWTDTANLRLFSEADRPAFAAAYDAEELAIHKLLPSDGLYYFVLYVLTDWDLLEHGGGVGGSWLTDKGKQILAALEGEAADEFAMLCKSACIHGYADDEIHDCANTE